ncbi:hypothetical protein HRI_000708100 [Hibiscus trionum]|uniref:Reverse transcriptase n=1 Tax=Hibiscus trionum TaxID=183268 RepID=A0A9W7H4Q1_HIBTR|nr:hypothetical protein HRI_000708100 [Hibiscus trionum]
MTTIKATLDQFCSCSGHKVSESKTKIYFSKNCDVERRYALADSGGFELVEDLGTYLGVPLLHKRVTKATYRFLIEKVERRLSGWASRTLSLAGRITLAKAILKLYRRMLCKQRGCRKVFVILLRESLDISSGVRLMGGGVSPLSDEMWWRRI